MTQPHNRRLKFITLTFEGESFECQLNSWKIVNNTEDGEKLYSFCPDGETREEADPDYALDLKFFADWRSDGISEFLAAHDGEIVDFQLDHLYDVVGEHIRKTGQVKIKDPTVGGDVRTTELTEIVLPIIGKPVHSRP